MPPRSVILKTLLMAQLMATLLVPVARAEPGYYVVTPYDNEGKRIVDFRYWTTKPKGQGETIWPELGVGLGVTSRWTTELFMSWIGSQQGATRPDTLNWQNQVLLTQGEWPVDVALHLQWVRGQGQNTERSIEYGALLQTDVGRLQLNANVILERPLGVEAGQPTQLKLQWQLRQRSTPQWHWGVQGFDELGAWNHFAPHAKQSHRAGPAAFGTWHVADGPTFKVQAAWLMGRTYGRSGHMFTMRAHTEF